MHNSPSPQDNSPSREVANRSREVADVPPTHAGEGAVAPSFVLVGPGKVGLSLGRALVELGARCLRVGARQGPTAERRQGLGEASWESLGELRSDDADLLLITVSDPALDGVAEDLARRPQAPVALHVAGRFDAAKLLPLRQEGCSVGSLHPLRAFPRILRSDELAGTWYAVDGDPPALDLATRLATALGGRSAEVQGAARAVYHLAATLAAGGVVTLLAAVEELTEQAGLPDEMLDGYLELTRGALSPLFEGKRPAASQITGPAARNDRRALEDQRAALAAVAPHLLPLVTALQRETLRCRGHLEDGEQGHAGWDEFAQPSE